MREHTPKQSDTDDRVRYMSLDGDGMILRRREGTYKNNAFSQTTAEKGRDAVFTYGSGQQLAEQTRDGTKLDVFGLMGMRDAGPAGKDQQKFINKQARKGNVMGAYDQIAQRYSVYGQDGATRVQVQSGDTLQGIAQRVYGNSSLWYVLAAANALSGDSELIAGTQLRVPEVGVSKNDASTFKPYNPNEIVGSTSPGLPYIPPASSNTCAVVAMAIVAIVVTIYTAGAATSALAPFFGVSGSVFAGTTATLGISALTGGLTGFAGLGMAAAAVGGLVGSIAAQVVGKALGAVDNFSWRQAVGAGITGGLTAGIGSYLGPMSTLIEKGQWGRVAASAALSATSSYVGNELAGVKGNSFSWKSIAASAVTAVVAGKINKTLGTVYDKFNGVNAILGQTVGSMVSNAVSVNVRSAFGIHERTDWKAMAADAFGNAVGNAIVSGMIIDSKRLSKLQDGGTLEEIAPDKKVVVEGGPQKSTKEAIKAARAEHDLTKNEARVYLDLLENERKNYEQYREQGLSHSDAITRAAPDLDQDPNALRFYEVRTRKVTDKEIFVDIVGRLPPDKLEGAVFINGISNVRDRAAELSGYHMAADFNLEKGMSYGLIHNPTNGALADLWEAFRDKIGWSSTAAKALSNILRDASDDGRKLWIVAHSQGGVMATEAIRLAHASSGKALNGIEITYHSGANNQWRTNQILRDSGVKTFGGLQASGYRDAPNDAVPQIVGLRGGLNLAKIMHSMTDFPKLFDESTGPWDSTSPHTYPYKPNEGLYPKLDLPKFNTPKPVGGT